MTETNDRPNGYSPRSYPKAIWYIFGNEFCERFSYYGLKAILVLFFIKIQKYDNDSATNIFHMFLVFSFLAPFFGAIIADSYWGKYKTIYALSLVHAVGNIVVALASLITSISLHFQRLFTIAGLLLTAVGAGGIKPCISSFGGDQFVLPDQEDLLEKFFSIFYFSINAGSLCSVFITPELRQSVHCFGNDSCFPLAFGLPAVLMLISMVFFVGGKRLYTIKKPVSSVITTSVGCMSRALKNKVTASPNEAKKNDWLEYADDKYDKHAISDLRLALDVTYLFIPLPLFYTLFDQQGSKWTLQGTLMNGKIDFLNWTMKPDQVILINPLFVLIFMPLFNVALYPVLNKIGINTPLRKITLGGMMAALSFVCAAILQHVIMNQNLVPSSKGGHLRIYNDLDCKVTVSDSLFENFTVEPQDVFYKDYNSADVGTPDLLFIKAESACQLKTSNLTQQVFIVNGTVSSYFLTYKQHAGMELKHLNELKILRNGNPNLRILMNDEYFLNRSITLRDGSSKKESFGINIQLPSLDQNQNFEIRGVGTYNMYLDDDYVLGNVNLLPASVNDLWIHRYLNRTNAKLITFEKGMYIHILWQVPQMLFITAAEVLFVVTLLEFSYTQAPKSMTSFISAINLCTQGVGNFLIVILPKIIFIENQTYEYILYAVLMVISMVIFMMMSARYKYKSLENR